jgi:cholesterol transport system auxiliary component
MTSNETSRRRFCLVAGSAALLAGCGGIIGPVPMQLYRLAPGPDVGELPAVRWRLAIGTPVASAALDTDRIALGRTQDTLDYFAGSAWTDRLPLLWQGLLLQRFEDSGRIAGVARDTEALRADYLLQTELRAFEARYASGGGPPEILVAVEARLIRLPAREIAARLAVEERAPARANALDPIVEAFDGATGAALDRIVAWTLAAPAPG